MHLEIKIHEFFLLPLLLAKHFFDRSTRQRHTKAAVSETTIIKILGLSDGSIHFGRVVQGTFASLAYTQCFKEIARSIQYARTIKTLRGNVLG